MYCDRDHTLLPRLLEWLEKKVGWELGHDVISWEKEDAEHYWGMLRKFA